MAIELRIQGLGQAQSGPVEFKSSATGPSATQAAHNETERIEDKKDLSPSEIEGLASEVQIYLKRLNTELRFEVNKDLKEVVVKIIDPETEEVIRQIPPDEVLAMRERMADLIGVLYNSET